MKSESDEFQLELHKAGRSLARDLDLRPVDLKINSDSCLTKGNSHVKFRRAYMSRHFTMNGIHMKKMVVIYELC